MNCTILPDKFHTYSNLFDFQHEGRTVTNEWTVVAVLYYAIINEQYKTEVIFYQSYIVCVLLYAELLFPFPRITI